MGTVEENSFDELVEKFLGEKLPGSLSGTVTFAKLSSDTQRYILRMLFLMKRSKYSADNINPILTWWLSSSIPNLLPIAWGGRIPPITLPGRHKKFDDYVANMDWNLEKTQPVFLDIGCGFPPVTTADTANKFPKWEVIGIDQSFAEYALYDRNGYYACFDTKGEFQYYQRGTGTIDPDLMISPVNMKKRFNQLFTDLLPLMPKSGRRCSKTVKKDGNRLIYNHIQDFEKSNLKFIKSSVMNLKLPPAKVCRIMNMLIYFKPDIRKQILKHAAAFLDNDGIIITGTNGLGSQSRYIIYKKADEVLLPKEFAFSLDNLSHLAIMPWFTIVKNDPEAFLLANLCRSIRNDRSFWQAFSNRMDELLKEHGICNRGTDGCLSFPKETMPLDIYFNKNASIWHQMAKEEYSEKVISVLIKSGWIAWKNSVGDISVKPPKDIML